MSKYDKYRVTSQTTPDQDSSKRWSKYLVQNNGQPEEKSDSNLALIGKSLLKGAGSIADIPNLVARGVEGLARSQAESERQKMQLMGVPNTDIPTPEFDMLSSRIPTSNDAREFVKSKTGIDLEPRPKGAKQRIMSKAAEFAGSLGPFGMVGKAGSALNATKLAGTGAGIGTTSGLLQEAGVNPLVADLSSSVTTPNLLSKFNPKNITSNIKNIKEHSAKIPLKIMGLGPNRFKKEAGIAGKELGIDMPAVALTDSTLTGLADQWLGKTPLFGNKLKHKYATAEAQTRGVLDDIYQSVGPSKTPEIEGRIADLYNKSISDLPVNAKIKPTHLKKAIDNIKINTAVLSPSEKDLIKTLDTIKSEIEPTSKMVSQFGSIKIPVQEFDVNKLIGTKKSLNSMIKWDIDEGVKNHLRKVQKAITQDIAEYGKTNPDWYKSFQDADNLFANVAKREKVEGLLGAINPATGALSYNKLAKSINNKASGAILKKQVPKEIYQRIEKLGKVASAMAVKSSNIPNPSGTAMTAASLGLISGLVTNPVAVLSGSGVASVLGAKIASSLLTDKKFLDLALKLATKPNKANIVTSVALNKRIKDLTGYSAISLNKKLNEQVSNDEVE